MKKRFLKILSTVLVAILVVGIAPINEAIASEMKISANGVIKTIGEAVESFNFTLPEINIKAEAYEYLDGIWNDTTKTLTIIGNGKMPDYNKTVPFWLNLYKDAKHIIVSGNITNIGSYAFENMTELEDVVIEAPITYINAYAFKGCTNLKSCVIPDTVTKIMGGIFAGCNLESLTTPFVGGGPDNTSDSKTDQLGYMFGTTEYENTYAVKSRIDKKVYYYIPYSLKSVTVTKKVYKYNFENCVGIEEIIIADTVEATGYPNYFAYGCTALKNVVTNTKKLSTGVGAAAFQKCSSLESFIIPNSIKWIGEDAFNGCSSLASVSVPSGDFYIRLRAFNDTPFWDNQTDEFVIMGDGVLVKYNGTDTNVVIPEGVKRVCCAFANREDILSIQLPDGLKYITADSFYGCLGITELVIPDSVQIIDAEALRGLCNVKSLSIPFTGNSRNATKESTAPLFGYIFGTDSKCPVCNNNKCTTDTQYYQKRNANNYYDYSFSYLYPKSLYTVTVTDNLIPRDAFRSSNVKKVVLGDGVTDIYIYSFYASSLKEIVFNEVITILPSSAFGKCSNLKSVTLTSSIKTINGAFENCTSLNTVNFVEGLESINKGFLGCEYLKNVTLPDSLKSISNKAFGNCKSIKEIYFGKGIQEISPDAFIDDRDDYRSIEAFYVDEENPYLYSFDGVIYSRDGVLVAYPENRKAESFYVNKNVKKIYQNTLDQMDITKEFIVDPDNEYLTAIDGVLYNKDVTTVLRCPREKTGDYVSPESVNEVVSMAFFWCRSLDKIEFVNDKVDFEEAAFQGADVDELIAPNFDKNLLYYFRSPNYAGDLGWAKIKKLKITNQTDKIPDNFTKYIGELESVEIDGTYWGIGDYAFSGDHFEEFTIPDSVISIGRYAFDQSDIKIVYGGNNVEKIGRGAFSNTELEYFKMPEALETIESFAFAGVHLTEVVFHDKLVEVGYQVFNNAKIKKAVINEAIVHLSDELFVNCFDLETVVIGGAVEEVGEQAFAYCTSLETVVIPNSVVEISDDAFLEANEDVVIYCNEGSYAEQYAITNEIKYTTLVIDPIENQTYTGREIEPEVNTSANNRRLTKDTEYTVTYKDNINAGSAKAVVKGLGDFKHLAATAKFTILPKSAEGVRVLSGSSTYNPNGVKPKVYAFSDVETLVEGQDFEILNTPLLKGAGEYNIAVSFIGNYYGVTNITYTVSRRSISSTDIEYGDTIKITFRGETLKEGRDYTVTKEIDENGDIVTTIKGMGNYKGTYSYIQEGDNQSILSWFENLFASIKRMFEQLFNIAI